MNQTQVQEGPAVAPRPRQLGLRPPPRRRLPQPTRPCPRSKMAGPSLSPWTTPRASATRMRTVPSSTTVPSVSGSQEGRSHELILYIKFVLRVEETQFLKHLPLLWLQIDYFWVTPTLQFITNDNNEKSLDFITSSDLVCPPTTLRTPAKTVV